MSFVIAAVMKISFPTPVLSGSGNEGQHMRLGHMQSQLLLP